MRREKLFATATFLTGLFLLEPGIGRAQEGVIYKAPVDTGRYCNIRFPAIDEKTLSWDRPVLKDKGDGDIIDFYGQCDYDPLGEESVSNQKDQLQKDEQRAQQ